MNLERHLLVELRSRDSSLAQKITGINFVRTQASTIGGIQCPTKSARIPFGLNIEKNRNSRRSPSHCRSVRKRRSWKINRLCKSAVALASQGQRVGLMDCDVYGPSAPILLGIRGEIESWPRRQTRPENWPCVKTVSFGFLSDVKSPVIWRGPLVSAVEQLCFDVDWGNLDTLVVDMPPGTGDVQLTITERLPIHAAVIVTTPQDVALIDAHKAVSMFERLDVPIAGVVENMAWYECPKCDHKEHIFGQESF